MIEQKSNKKYYQVAHEPRAIAQRGRTTGSGIEQPQQGLELRNHVSGKQPHARHSAQPAWHQQQEQYHGHSDRHPRYLQGLQNTSWNEQSKEDDVKSQARWVSGRENNNDFTSSSTTSHVVIWLCAEATEDCADSCEAARHTYPRQLAPCTVMLQAATS